MITILDICDRGGCPAPAQIEVTSPRGRRLAFCGHDYRRYEFDLAAQGFRLAAAPAPEPAAPAVAQAMTIMRSPR